uniref:Uncharacterized protein n=1 Tax=Sphaerodactylus townsendi TaxID=933632 RepID=A0ACB8EAY2_9SAUR
MCPTIRESLNSINLPLCANPWAGVSFHERQGECLFAGLSYSGSRISQALGLKDDILLPGWYRRLFHHWRNYLQCCWIRAPNTASLKPGLQFRVQLPEDLSIHEG